MLSTCHPTMLKLMLNESRERLDTQSNVVEEVESTREKWRIVERIRA